MEQNRDPRNKPKTYGQLIYDREVKNIQQRKDSLFNKWWWKNWAAMCKNNEIRTFLFTIYKNKLKIVSPKWNIKS